MPEAPKPSPQDTLAQRSQALLNELWGDKDLGPAVRRAAKKKFPDITIPEDNTDPALEELRAETKKSKEELQALLDKVAERDKQQAERDAEASMAKQLSEARTKFALSDDGYQKMLDRMKGTSNFTDPEAAAAWVVSQLPKPEPHNDPSWLPKSMNLFGSEKAEADERFKSLHTDPRRYVDEELREFAKNPDKYVNETLGQAA